MTTLVYHESLVQKQVELVPDEPVRVQFINCYWVLGFTALINGKPVKRDTPLRLGLGAWILGDPIDLCLGQQVLRAFTGQITQHPLDERKAYAVRSSAMEVLD